MQKTDSIISALATLSAVLGAVTPDAEVRLLAFNALGSVAGGYVGASIGTDAPTGRTTMARRWVLNFAAGLFVGPVATEWLITRFPDFSQLYLAIFAGGACGLVSVSVFCILLPWLITILPSILTKITSRLP